jgi:2-polyprenyl-3-methyl-5-hydroxy-6-metoxy-1,4-benzoquinol methylase/glycosyltransferase involved in cell wall biosynthesis
MSDSIRADLDGMTRITTNDVDPANHHFIALSILNRWLAEVALPRAQGVLLDFGCGGQPYRELFKPKITRYIGADVAIAKGVQLDLELVPGKPVPLRDASIDTVLSTQTIEHVYDSKFYLGECYRLLKPGGVLILSAPMQWRLHEVPHDYWRFTRYGLSELLTQSGFVLDVMAPCGGACALAGQIINSHLSESGRGKAIFYRIINRLALWLDKRLPDSDDTLGWMCLCHKPEASQTITLSNSAEGSKRSAPEKRVESATPLACPVCGSADIHPICNIRDYEIYSCTESATDFVWPMPDAEDLKALYDRPAYFEGNGVGGYQSYDTQTAHSLPMVAELLDNFPKGSEPLSILDIGCAYGTHLRLAADRGCECFGVELSMHARQIAAERHGNLLTIVERIEDLPPRRFDLILMMDIIEHMPDPYSLFFSLFNKGAITPKTRILISTPNAGSLDATADPCSWIYRHPPSHLVYYSAKSLLRFLQRLHFKEIRITGAYPLSTQATPPKDETPAASNDGLREFGAIICESSGSDFESFMKERYVPGTWLNLTAYEHLPRYALARTLAQGKRVLDFGCGTGYGSASLAEVAQSVVGMDIDAGAVEWARTTHRKSNLHFEQRADLGRGLAPASFDLITCFEVIEHVNQQTQLDILRSMADLLAPSGKVIISTPNPKITACYGNNPYHLREMTDTQFMELLQPFFKHIEILNQWINPGILIAPQNFAEGQAASTRAMHRKIEEGIPAAYITVCSQEPFEIPQPFCQFDASVNFSAQTVEAERCLDRLRIENSKLKSSKPAEPVRKEQPSTEKLGRAAYLIGASILPLAVKRMIKPLAIRVLSPFENLKPGSAVPQTDGAKPMPQTGLHAEASSNAVERQRASRSNLKVALFVHCFFPWHYFGTETYTLQLAKNLRRLGHRPVIVSAIFQGEPRQSRFVTQYSYDDIPVYCIDKNFAPHSSIQETYYQESMRGVLKDLLKEIQPDLVHVTHLLNHTAALIDAAEELGLPLVATMTDFFGFCFNNRLQATDGSICPGPSVDRSNCIACSLKAGDGRLANLGAQWPKLTTFALNSARRIPGLRKHRFIRMAKDLRMRPDVLAARYAKYRAAIAPTRFLHAAYTANGLSTHCFDIPYGVDLPRDPKPPRTEGQPITFGFMGQIAPHKGTDLLVHAFTRLPKGTAILKIYGPEDQDAAFMAKLRRAAEGFAVHFQGPYAFEKTSDVLRDMDVLVIPSRWGENSPLVLLDALATHTPVVVSDAGGLTEFVEDSRSGFKFTMGSAAALEEVMQKFIRDPQLIVQMSQSTEFGWTTHAMTEEVLKVYDYALDQ